MQLKPGQRWPSIFVLFIARYCTPWRPEERQVANILKLSTTVRWRARPLLACRLISYVFSRVDMCDGG